MLHNLDTSPIQFEPVATFTQFMCKCGWDTRDAINFCRDIHILALKFQNI